MLQPSRRRRTHHPTVVPSEPGRPSGSKEDGLTEIQIGPSPTRESLSPAGQASSRRPASPAEAKASHLANKDTHETRTDVAGVRHHPPEYITPADPVWKDYLKEAVEEDRDMLDAWNNDLDTLLVFAGLFSAILTAFLIEAHKELKPDPSEAIVSAIQVAFRTSTNSTSSDFGSSVYGEKPFEASPRSVRVNTFWFTSLALSLMTAASAMLAKSWLVAYSRQLSLGPPFQRAERRHKRFNGLRRWKFRDVMDFLPFPLYLSILLFCTGLCDFLYGLNNTVATLSTAVFSFGILALVFVTLLRLFIPESPYHIPVPFSTQTISVSLNKMSLRMERLSGTFLYHFLESLHVIQNLVQAPITGLRASLLPPLAACLALAVPLLPLSVLSIVLWCLTNVYDKLVQLNKLWQNLDPTNYTWKAAALSWLIETSSDEESVTKALQLIPAASNEVVGANPLCNRGVYDSLVERFMSVFETVVPDTEDEIPFVPGREPDLETYAHCLRLLLDQPGSAFYVLSQLRWQVSQLYFSKRLDHRLISSTLCRLVGADLFPREIIHTPWLDIRRAANQDSQLGDWLRLSVMKDIVGDAGLFRAKRKDALSLVCAIMQPVKIRKDSSTIFLESLSFLLATSPSNPFQLGHLYVKHDGLYGLARLLDRCFDSIMTYRPDELAPPPTSPPEEEQAETWESLEAPTILLLAIIHWLADAVNSDPDAVFFVCKNFIQWSMIHPHFSINVRKQAAKTLEQCMSYVEQRNRYVQGWEAQIMTTSSEIVSCSTESGGDAFTLPAVALAIQTFWCTHPDSRSAMMALLENDPRFAQEIVSLFKKGSDSHLRRFVRNRVFQGISTVTDIYYYDGAVLPRMEAIEDGTMSDECMLVCRALTKLIDAGLAGVMLHKLKYGDKRAVSMALQLIKAVALLPSLAKSVLDIKLVEQLLKRDQESEQRLEYRYDGIRTALVLYLRVREMCDEDERDIWLHHLMEFEFLSVINHFLPRMNIPERRLQTLWDISRYLRLFKDLLPNHKDSVISSGVLETTKTVLIELEWCYFRTPRKLARQYTRRLIQGTYSRS